MLNIEILIMQTLLANSSLTAIVDRNNILFGPPDFTVEKQSTLAMPQINVHLVSEAVRTVPQGATDSVYQIDIWSRNNQMELENIYNQIQASLNFISGDQSTNHLFWERLGEAIDNYETDMRLWHRATRFIAWSI